MTKFSGTITDEDEEDEVTLAMVGEFGMGDEKQELLRMRRLK